MANENVNVQMKLISVKEISFMMSPTRVDDTTSPDDIKIGFSSQLHPDIKKDEFALIFGIRYVYASETVLECLYEFLFKVKNLSDFVVINTDQSITVSHLMPHFLSVAVGTMRGILVVKTAGSLFSKYPLPMIDINLLNANLSLPSNNL